MIETERKIIRDGIVILLDGTSNIIDHVIGHAVLRGERIRAVTQIGDMLLAHTVNERIHGQTRLVQLQAKYGCPYPLVQIDLGLLEKVLQLERDP